MSVLVHQDKSAGLAVGVDWSVLAGAGEKANAAAIRKRASLIGAKNYCTTHLHDTTYIGLYTPPIELPGSKTIKPKKVHSLAMVFRNAFTNVDAAAINAVLLMSPQDSSTAIRLVLVVIEGGQVVYNKLDDATKALAKAREFTSTAGIAYSVFGNTHELASSEPITWDQLQSYANASSELKPVPVNTIALGAVVAIASLAAAAVAYNYFVLAPAKARAKLLAQQAANNHTPQYMERLNTGLLKAGWAHADMLAFLKSLKTQAAYNKGWELKKIECSIDTSACEFEYARLGGTVKELIASSSDKTYLPNKSISDAEAYFNQPIKPIVHSLMGKPLPKPEDGNVALKNQAQRLLNAGANVTTTETKPWPNDGVDINKVEPAALVKRGGFEFKAPYTLSDTMLAQLPSHVVLKSFIADLNVGGDKADNIKMTFKGYSYVK